MKQVFLYIGVDNAFTRGGVGVHTRGTVEGVIDQQQFDEHWVLWPCAQQTYFYDEALQQTGVNLNYSAVINSQSFYHSLSYRLWCRLKVLASALKIGLKLSKYHKVTIYTRYSPWLTPLLIMFMHNKAYCVVESNYQDRNELDYTRPTLRKAPKKWLKTTRLYRRLFYLGEKYSCRRTALNLGINHEITQRLQNYGATQTDVSPCATSSQLIKTAESLRQQTARQRHNLNESNLILGYVGAVKASFHLDKLLVAMTYANYRSELKLLIASQMSDGYADTLAQFIGDLGMADQVIWRRPENREQCVEFIVASNVIPILRPYMGHSLTSMKYYEALGCGKPILASNIPYINEAPAMGFGQLVEDCHDVQEIAKALDHFYINKEYYHQLAPKIQAFARHNHTWQQRASAFLQQCHWLA